MWQFIDGCVIIRINGRYPERLLNLLRERAIPVRNVSRADCGDITLSVRARDFARIRPLVKKSRCRVHIVSRGGLPFATRRLTRRPVLLFGMIVAFAAIMFAGTRVMHITVDGCDRVPESVVLRALAGQGIRRFGAYPKGNLTDLAALARLYDERIAWLTLQLHGSHLSVTVTEMQPRVATLDPYTPCDVVAVKSGVLTLVEVYEGYSALAAGDTVAAGDVLVQGEFFPDTQEEVLEPLMVHARGKLMANVYYYGEYIAPATEAVYADGGRRGRYRKIAVGGWTLTETNPPFPHYEVRDVTNAEITDALLPVTVTDGVYVEQVLTEKPLTAAERTERALVEAERLAYLKIPKDAVIVDKDMRVLSADGVILGAVGVVTEESIGLEREIVH